MTFAAPLFLLAALAAAVPLLLHMIQRQKAKELPFPTLRFLKVSVQETRRRKRIHDLFLLLLRALVLFLIAIGLARPTITTLRALWGQANAAVAIVLDNSTSMGTFDQDRVRFEMARAAARQILDQLGDGDQVTLLVTGGPKSSEAETLALSQEKVRRVVEQCQVSYQRADLAAQVERARTMLAKVKAPNKQIFVVTDMQKMCWEGLPDTPKNGGDKSREEPQKGELPSPESAEIPIVVVDCNRAPKPNAAVQTVDVEAAIPLAGAPLKATVSLLNMAPVAQQRLVELLVDGTKEAVSPALEIPPGGRIQYTFAFSCKHGGLHRGEVRLVGDDGLKYDDSRYFSIEIDPGVPVAVVKARRHEIPYLEDSYYLERALSAGNGENEAIHVDALTADELAGATLDSYRVVFCVNLPTLDSAALERLHSYLERGGNVVWICGENVDPAAYNRMNEQMHGELLPARLTGVQSPAAAENRDSWRINWLDEKYPAFAQLLTPASLYESVLAYKRVGLDAKDAEVRVLARLDDGAPLLVQRTIGKGKALLLGTNVHVRWANLPLRPIFLPLVTQLTFSLAGVEQAQRTAVAGQPLVWDFPEATTPLGVEMVLPGGETLRLKTEGVAGAPGQKFQYDDTYAIGVYRLRTLDAAQPMQAAYAVNFDPEEADAAVLTHEQLQERLRPATLVFAANPDDLSQTFTLLREGRGLWSFFLTAVLIGLVFETLISNRLSPKRMEKADTRAPPYPLQI